MAPEAALPPVEFVDCSELRLGDRMALAWLAQQRRRLTGRPVGIVDRHSKLREPFSLTAHFPASFVDVTDAQAAQQALAAWDHGNLWITATNAYAQSGAPGCFEQLPVAVVEQARRLALTAARPRVLLHVLDDATYNFARNWVRRDARALVRRLRAAGTDVVELNPSRGRFTGGLEHMMAEMLAADLFVGGDTGPSHLFAMLCPDKPQIAIYPSMADDQRTYAPEQRQLGLPLPWCSLPLKRGVDVVTMSRRRALRWKGWKPRLQKVGRLDASTVAALAMARLARRWPPP